MIEMLVPVVIAVGLIAVAALKGNDSSGSRTLPSGPLAPLPDGAETCSKQFYPAVHSSGARPASALTVVVLHSTEGDTAAGAAGWFQNPASGGSTQIVVDDTSCYRCLDDLIEPWGAPGANRNGLHIELAGWSAPSKKPAREAFTREVWLQHAPMLERAARIVAAWCRQYKIPPVFVDAAGLKAGKHGVTTHREVTAAFHLSDHQDPGPVFPLDVFMARVAELVGAGGDDTPNV